MNPPVCQLDFVDADLRHHGCTIASGTYIAGAMSGGAAWRDPETYAARLRVLTGVPLSKFRERGTTLTELKVAYEAAPGFDGRVAPIQQLVTPAAAPKLPEGQDVRLPDGTSGTVVRK